MIAELSPLTAPALNSLSDDQWLASLQAVIDEKLVPDIEKIDGEGFYPRDFMQSYGAAGGFCQSYAPELGGGGRGLKATLQGMELVAQECLSTGFCVWCQWVCGWYIQNGDSDFLKTQILPSVLSGQRLAGTGLSNPMKHFAGIEPIRLIAQREAGGFRISGALPWISNVGEDHFFAAVARIEETEDYLMAVFPGDLPGLRLGDGGKFIALEGSGTYAAHFKDVFAPHDWVLAAPCAPYIARIRPGFILGQTGFGLGLVGACLEIMRRANRRTAHVNCFLDDTLEKIEADFQTARNFTHDLADEIGVGAEGSMSRPALAKDAIQARILASELALRASQAAMLYAGASGYRLGGPVERKLRESYFVAIVTPALKHLKKLQAAMN